MKNKILALIVSIVLLSPFSVQAVEEEYTMLPEEPAPIVNTIDEDNEVLETQFKQPVSKRKIAKKFLLAMAGVAVSSFSIFFLLTIYNRIREGFVQPTKTQDGEPSLETPDDLSGAVKTFLEKTNWNK